MAGKLVLCRHGQSQWNLENRFTGWMDVDLTTKGQEEALDAGSQIQGANLTFDIAYTSLLKRATKTLSIILEEMNLTWIPVIKCWELNERHYGALQGLYKAEVAKEYGEDQVKIWRRSYDIWQDKILPDLLGNKDVLVVAHGNSLRSLVKIIDNISDEEIVNLNIPTGIPLLYEFNENLNPTSKSFLGDEETIKKATEKVAQQGSIKK